MPRTKKRREKRYYNVGPVSKTKAEGGLKFTDQVKADDPLGRRHVEMNWDLQGDVNATMRHGRERYSKPKKQRIAAPKMPKGGFSW